MTFFDRLSCVLSLQAGCRLFQRMVDRESTLTTYLAEYVKPVLGDIILDCHVPRQSRIARWLPANDRGEFVRSREENPRLASGASRK